MDKIQFKKIDESKKILELNETATVKEIKKAYRRLSKQWHPDKCKKSDEKICHENMKRINEAYKILIEYVENYSYPLTKEKIFEDSPEERWMKQFGGDPLWGAGWDKK